MVLKLVRWARGRCCVGPCNRTWIYQNLHKAPVKFSYSFFLLFFFAAKGFDKSIFCNIDTLLVIRRLDALLIVCSPDNCWKTPGTTDKANLELWAFSKKKKMFFIHLYTFLGAFSTFILLTYSVVPLLQKKSWKKLQPCNSPDNPPPVCDISLLISDRHHGASLSSAGSIALHCTASRCTVLHCTVLCCTVLQCTPLYSIVLHCTKLHGSALHCTPDLCTALY